MRLVKVSKEGLKMQFSIFLLTPSLPGAPAQRWKLKNDCNSGIQQSRVSKFSISSLSSKVVFHQSSSSIKGHLPSMVVFHQRLSSVKGCLLSKVLFHQMSSPVKGRHLPKVFFRQRLSYVKGRVPLKVVFHQRLSFI